MKSILHKSFRYVPAASTDIKLTFARIRREQKLKQEQTAAVEAETARKVAKIGKAR